MKKRLLSAALALAMVLTLLPVSVFAAAADTGTAVTYYNVGQAFSNPASTQTEKNATTAGWYLPTRNTTVGDADYNKYTYTLQNSGIVTSGNKLYTSASAGGFPTSGTVYPLGGSEWTSASTTGNYTIDLKYMAANGTFALGSVSYTKPATGSVASSLTITDTSNPTGSARKTVTGSVTVGATGNGNGLSSFNTTFTNVNATGVSVTYYTSNGGQVNVNNAVVGDISMTGTTSAANQTTTTGGTVSLNGGHAGTISVTATTGGSIQVGTNQNSSGNEAGAVTIMNTGTSGNGRVTAYNATITAVNLEGIGTKLETYNTNISGAVSLFGNDTTTYPALPALTDAQKNSSTPPDVKIHGGSVGSIVGSSAENLTKPLTILVDGNAHVNTSMNLPNANLTVTSAHIPGITLQSGTLNVSGADLNAASVGNLILGLTGKTVNFNVTGKNVTTGTITKTGGTVNFTTVADDSNKFGAITYDSTGKFDNRGIKGGTFAPAGKPNPANLDNSLVYMIEENAVTVSYYGLNDFQAMVDRYQKHIKGGGAADTIWVHPVGQEVGLGSITFKDGNDTLLVLAYQAGTRVNLPTQLNGKQIAKWSEMSGSTILRDITIGYIDTPHTAANIVLNCQVTDNVISKLTRVTVVDAAGVTARLGSNTITLSGAVVNTTTGAAGNIPITLEITTDGDPGLTDAALIVDYNTAAKTATFNSYSAAAIGLTVNNSGALVMPDGTTVYTVNGSGLRLQADKLPASQVHGYTGTSPVEVKVTATGAGRTPVWQEALGNTMSAGATVDFSASPAVKEALNRAVASITDSQIDSWVRSAQTAAWRYEHPTGSPTNDQLAQTGYNQVHVVAYLAVTVSTYSTPDNGSGILTATLVPSYRVEVRGGTALPSNTKGSGFTTVDNNSYVAKAGATLGALDGEAGEIVVSLTKENTFNTTGAKAHQNDTYVYDVTGTGIGFTVNHTVSNGLGTIVINGVAAPVTRYATEGGAVEGTYDTLQAAVDDSEDGNYIDVAATYKGATNISVTGEARTFKINTNGANRITSNVAGLVKEIVSGTEYEVQLQRSVAAGNVEISVTANTAGTTSLSASKARAGDVITVTVQPNQGNTVTGVTARTNSGASVSVTASTTNANQYTFTVPAGATSVVVTPSFKVGNAQATVSVSASTQGSATTTAAATNNKVDAGSSVGVTTNPGVGYRTMGVNITTNGGAASANRVNDNYFTFTVPSNATAVTVTPVYDRDNGTKFTDVWSTEYYSKSVAWAVSKGVTDGQSTYLFGSNNYCTRAQMVTFLWRAAGKPSVVGISNPFVDVSPTLTPGDYYSAILWAVSQGITDGTDRTHFSPSKTVTRAEAVTFLYRYEKQPSAGTNSGFYDVPAGQWYARAVTWAAGKGITKGKTNTTFDPNAACRRCEIVTFLYRDVTGDIA